MLKRKILELQVDAPCVWRRKSMRIISLGIVGGFLRFGIYLSLTRVSWVQTSIVRDVVMTWRRRMKSSWVLGVGNMVPLAIWWPTWMWRNRHVF